jgi:hypothetical protein
MRKIILITLIFIIFSILFADNNFHFAIIGDRTGGANQEAFDKVINEINGLRPDFVINVGDFAESGGVLTDWDTPLTSVNIFDCKFYFTPGNHDIYDDKSEEIYINKTGFQPYYSFDYQESHFIVLDNSRYASYEDFEDKQTTWFENDLKNNQDKENIYVFMHKPFWANAVGEGKQDNFHQLLLQYSVDAVFTGHWHQYAHNNFDGIDYFLIGSSGGGMPEQDDDLGIFYQYMFCKVENKKLYPNLIKSGNIIPTDIMTIEEEQLSHNIRSKFIRQSAEHIIGNSYKAKFEVTNGIKSKLTSELIVLHESNWKIPNNNISVDIESGTTDTIEFQLENTGDFFPLPELTFNYPFGRNKVVNYNQILGIPRRISCNFVNRVPVIDGIVENNDMQKAEVIKNFMAVDPVKKNDKFSELVFLADKKYLYIAARFESKTDSLTANSFNQDENTSADDGIGFIISPYEDIVYQFYVNTNGAVWDMKSDFNSGNHDQKWNGVYDIKTNTENDIITIEMKIPLSELGITNQTNALRFNYSFFRQYDHYSAAFYPEWSYRSIKFGILEFEKWERHK